MARTSKPTRIDIRGYQVGFGDCFLLSFHYGPSHQKHVLIDFGTTALPPRGRARQAPPAKEHMPAIARDIAAVCEGKLTAVVATHRHADHISGFATDARSGGSGRIIRELRPDLVLQPWTEDPAAARGARAATVDSVRTPRSLVAGLSAMHRIAQAAHEIGEAAPPWLGVDAARELSFLGMDNIRNESAVRNLIAMGAAPGAEAVWAHHGSRSGLERHLPGVKVRVLGPPNLEQTEGIRTMRSRDADEFWHLIAGPRSLRRAAPIARGLDTGRRPRSQPPLPAEARWFKDRLETLRGEQLLQIVRSLDDSMNNTSLILLLEVGGKKLLFPGDAQLENWSYALEDAPDAARTRKLLAGVDVYKVGHHGSLNATPRQMLWDRFARRGRTRGAGMQTLLSTLPGKHGRTASQTEVPRRTLLAALRKETHLSSTHELKAGARPELCYRVTVEP